MIIGIAGRGDRQEVRKGVDKLLTMLKAREAEYLVEEGLAISPDPNRAERAELVERADILMVIGGDGTLLGLLREYPKAWDKPIIGVKTKGSLGFLMEIDLNEAISAIDSLLNGSFVIEFRDGLKVTDDDGRTWYLLNEIIVRGEHPGKALKASIKLSAHLHEVYRGSCDGILVASPTGSTAYSLSLGGPVLDPSLEAMLVMVLSPLNLSQRPLIVPLNYEVEIRVHRRKAILVGDGEILGSISEGGAVKVERGKRARFIRLKEDFYMRLRERLSWC